MKYLRVKNLSIPLKASVVFVLIFNTMALFAYAAGAASQDEEATLETIVNLESTSPIDGATDVSRTSPIKVNFDGQVNIADADLISITSEYDVDINFTLNAGPNLIINHDEFSPGTEYTVSILAGALSEYEDSIIFSFTTTGSAFEVVSTSPEDGETEVGLDGSVTVEFSNNVESVDYSFISVKDDEGSDVAWLDFGSSGNTISIYHPNLEPETEYTVTIDAEAIEALQQDFSFSFTTEEAPQPPVVSSTTPEDGETGVSVDTDITINFDQLVYNYGISSINISYEDEGESEYLEGLSISISGENNDKIFIETGEDLDFNTTYSVNIPSSAVSNPNDQFNEAYSFSFTTEEATPPIVESTEPENNSYGADLSDNIIITFNEPVRILDIEGFSIYDESENFVDNVQPAFDIAVKNTPEASIFYEVVSVSHDDFEENKNYTLGIDGGTVENEAGVPNESFTLNFSTYASSPPTVTTLTPEEEADAAAVDTEISVTFDETVYENDLSGVRLYDFSENLVAGTSASVSGDKLTISHPTLQPDTSYFVIIPSNAIVDADEIGNEFINWNFSTEEGSPPVVDQLSPANEAQNVPVDTEVSVTFDQPISANNLSDVAIYDFSEQQLPNTSASVSGNKLTITHPGLEPNTGYFVTIPAGSVINGNEIGNSFINWQFETVEGIAPVVESVLPASGAELVALDAEVGVVFQGNIFPLSLSDIVIQDSDGNELTGVSASAENNELQIQHDDFKYGQTYTVTIPPNIFESSTGILNSEISWSFSTLSSPPAVASTSPEEGASSVSVDTPIEATFDKPISAGDLSQIQITDDQNNSFNGLSADIDGSRIIISGAELEMGTMYTVSLGSGVVLNSGGLPNEAFSWSFSTTLSAPEVTSTSPGDDESSVAIDAPVSATFSLPIEAAGLQGVTIADEDGEMLSGVSASVEGNELSIDHPNFKQGTTYTVSLDEGVVINQDGVENGSTSWSFTTILSPPEPTELSPLDGQTGVELNAVIEVGFDQVIALEDPEQIQLIGSDQPLEGLDLQVSSNILTITTQGLASGTEYSVSIGEGAVSNADGVANESVSWSFTTILPAPEVSATAPEDGQAGVALDAEVRVVFTQPVEAGALDGLTISDESGQNLSGITGTVEGAELMIDHAEFTPGTTYTVRLEEGVVTNADGVESEAYSWSFTSILPAPQIISTTPEAEATGVEIHTVIQAEFDLPVELADEDQVELSGPEGAAVEGLTVEVTNNILSVTAPQLVNGATYNMDIGAGAVSNADGISNESVSWSFTTILSAPEVLATKPADNALSADIEADISILFNQSISEGDFSQIEFTDASDNLVSGIEATIEDSTLFIQHSGLEHLTDYLVQIPPSTVINSDGVNNEQFQFRFTTVADISEEVVTTVNRDFGDASSPTSYRLIALPGNIQVPLPEVLGSNGETWKAFWDNGADENYLIEYEESELFHLKPGNGFWLISADNFSYNENIPAVELNESNQAEISLHAGWNIISNPMDVDVGWDVVEEANGEDLQPLWAFNESFEAAPVFMSAKGGEAFYFFNETNLESLLIPYIEHSPEKKSTDEAVKISVVTLVDDEVSSKSELILNPETIPGKDYKQVISPPGGFEEASIRFLNNKENSSKSRTQTVSTKVSSYNAFGQSFDMVLKTTAGTPVTVVLENAQNSMNNDELLVLIDKHTGIAYELTDGGSAEIIPEKDTTELLFVVGTEQYLEDEHAGYLPDEITINQNYPNPFNPTTTLSFSIPEKSVVDVSIYNLLGQEVGKLISRKTLSAGAHQLRFDGSGFSSGLYIVRYTMDNQHFNQKVLLIK